MNEDTNRELRRLPVADRNYAVTQAVEAVWEDLPETEYDERDEVIAGNLTECLSCLHNDEKGQEMFILEAALQSLRASGYTEVETVLRRYSDQLGRAGEV